MTETAFIALINNAALLMTLAYAYSLISVYEKERSSILLRVFMGFVVGLIGLSIIMTAWEPEAGIKFDARSVLLAGAGLFLGAIPAAIAMIITGVFVWLSGGPGWAPGVTVILASGLIGILFRGSIAHRLVDIKWRELYVFGLTVHVAILAVLFLLPIQDALRLLKTIWLPIILLYPPMTMLFGQMMALRLQRERIQTQLRDSEERHRSLFENNHSVMLMIDPAHGQILDANHAAAGFYGVSREELMRMKMPELVYQDPDPAKATAAAKAPDALAGDAIQQKHRARGQVRDVEIYSDTITIEGRPLRYAIIHDITEEKRMEEQLRQAQKMEAVGWLAGGVAHDYNNKLQAVLGFAEMAQKEAIGRPRLRGYLSEIRTAARHSAQLTQQLMAFARKQTMLPVVLNMNDTIARMLKMIKNMIGEDIELDWKPGHDIWHVLIDASQIDRVLVNLALNARDAIPDVGRISFETRNEVVSEEEARMYPEAKAGEYVVITIRDTGTGMTPEQLKHIFEPFYTTKEVGHGTGLGLATVYGVIRQAQGFIQVTSELGAGTAFHLYLPRTLEKLPEIHHDKESHEPLRGEETVLLVEDEKLVLELVKETLKMDGYKVISAPEPETALKLAAATDERIDILVTDVVMPGMNGRALYDAISARRPDIKVLYMSGYTANANISRGVLDSGINYIQKPFSIATISAKVREVLDGNRGNRPAFDEEEINDHAADSSTPPTP